MQEDTVVKGRLVYANPERVIAARGTHVLESFDSGNTWRHLGRLPVGRKAGMLLADRRLRRLLRMGVHHLEVGDTWSLLIANKTAFRLDGSTIEPLGPVEGSRPLALCRDEDAFYYGEYRPNPERTPVHIWQWRADGKQWERVWQFTGVRHVHGVFLDPYTDVLWVTTGDDDEEAGIWRTNDGFSSLVRVVGGSQQFRAVQLLFTRDHVYFGSDAPDRQNHIYRMDRQGKSIEALTTVGGPIFYGCRVGESLFFSTAVERSRVNAGRHAEVWGSADGVNWKIVRRFRKDIWPMKYFQYGQVLFPDGPGDRRHLWLTPMATEYDQETLKIPVREIFAVG